MNTAASNAGSITSPKSDTRLAAPSRAGDSSIRQRSPLSRPVDLRSDYMEAESHRPAPSDQPVPQSQPYTSSSPAANQLAALSQKDAKKSGSKLRRAFAFGSAEALRKATAQNNHDQLSGIYFVGPFGCGRNRPALNYNFCVESSNGNVSITVPSVSRILISPFRNCARSIA